MKCSQALLPLAVFSLRVSGLVYSEDWWDAEVFDLFGVMSTMNLWSGKAERYSVTVRAGSRSDGQLPGVHPSQELMKTDYPLFSLEESGVLAVQDHRRRLGICLGPGRLYP